MDPLRALAATWLAIGRAGVVVEVVEARGSVPRGAGTRMLVGEPAAGDEGAPAETAGTMGTIGGGHLELLAIAEARALLAAAERSPRIRRYPLGPALGQCCGGAVALRLALLDDRVLAAWPDAPPRFHLQLYGAGHVGRAMASALAPMNVVVDWIDERDDVFTEGPGWADPAGSNASTACIRRVCVDAVEAEVASAPAGAFYLVMTHRHDLDLRIAEAILARGDFGYFGLIGSRTKRQRFVHRLEQRGIDADAIARMKCPIGIAGIEGKEPEVIAAAVVAELLLVSSASGRPLRAGSLSSQRLPG
jgi:xanthine dehydrogenase accessory factor